MAWLKVGVILGTVTGDVLAADILHLKGNCKIFSKAQRFPKLSSMAFNRLREIFQFIVLTNTNHFLLFVPIVHFA